MNGKSYCKKKTPDDTLKARRRGQYRKWYYKKNISTLKEYKKNDLFNSLVGKTNQTITTKQVEDTFKKFRPHIDKLLNRVSNKELDQRSELKQLALIAIWAVLSETDGNASPQLIYHELKKTIYQGKYDDESANTLKPCYKTWRKYNDAVKQYVAKYNAEPTADELANFMNVSITQVHNYYQKLGSSYRTLDQCEKVSEAHKIAGSWWYERKEEYENGLIYFVDKHWVLAVKERLNPLYINGLNAIMSENTITEWATRQGSNHSRLKPHINKGLWWCRVLADLRYKLNDPRDPMQYLQDKGFKVSMISKQLANRYPTVEEKIYNDEFS